MAPLATLLAACSPAAPTPSAPPAASVAPVARARPAGSAAEVPPPVGSTWTSMGSAADKGPFEAALDAWSQTSQCSDYDYFPNGGIQNFWCHRPEGLTLEKIRSLAGVDLFVSGPHAAGALKLDAGSSFGHYNPAFVRWLVDHGPSERGSMLRQMTQAHYDESMRPLAEIFWRTHLKIEQDDSCFQRERDRYAKLVAARSLPARHYERWYFFMNPAFCPRAARGQISPNDTYFYDHGMDGGVDGNVTKTAVGFWIRRSLDGTMPTFVEGLRKLIAAYEPALLTADPLPAPIPSAPTLPIPQVIRNPFNLSPLQTGF